MIASKHACGSAAAEHRLNILRQEEIDREVEEATRLTGGHQLGGTAPAALLAPRHAGLSSTEEHAMWLKDISRWQGEYSAIVADLERVHAFIVENGDDLRNHAEALTDMIAEYDAMIAEYETLKANHIRARGTHEQAAEHHEGVMRRVRRVANAMRDAFSTPPTPGREPCSVTKTERSHATT